MSTLIFVRSSSRLCRPAAQVTCAILLGLLLTVSGCATQTADVKIPDHLKSETKAEKLYIVDCLLPTKIKKLGRNLIFAAPRRAVRTSALECEQLGGEYEIPPLRVWLPPAKEGDVEAQVYVGEIFEKGLGVPRDYTLAAEWYRKAAAQESTRAQINLGHLYEKGLGVEKDSAQAVQWYRRASGLNDAIALDTGSIRFNGSGTDVQQELQALRQEVERWKRQAESLQQQLEQTQQQLVQTRQDLQQRQSEIDTERQKLDQARQELERRKQLAAAARDDVEVDRLEAQLQQREAALASRQQEVARLKQEISTLNNEVEQHRAQLAEVEKQRQQVALAGPTIEVLDPPLVAGTRGLSVVNVSPQIKGQDRPVVGRVISPAGLHTFTVNDRQVSPDEKGFFRVPISVRGPRVPVKMVAVDQQGKREIVEFQLAANGADPTAAQPQKTLPDIRFGDYYALIIGNNDYTDWPDLNTPITDAKELAEILQTHYGFKTQLLFNATRFDVLQALNELRKTLTDQDNLLVYYAGHGHWDEQIERAYWVPVDGHVDSNVNWIPTFAITDMLGAMVARHILIVADSCYSGALTRSAMLARLEAGTSEEARRHRLEVMAEKRSRTVLSSGGLQPVLDTGGGDHSVFAKAFLDVLSSNTEIIEGQRIGSEVSARVSWAVAAAQVQQDPQYAPIRFGGHEAGDFIFVPRILRQ